MRATAARIRDGTSTSDELKSMLDQVTEFQQYLVSCKSALIGENRDSDIAGIYVAAQVRVTLLRALNEVGEAYKLALETAGGIDNELAKDAPPIREPFAQRLRDVKTWLLQFETATRSDNATPANVSNCAPVGEPSTPGSAGKPQFSVGECYFTAHDWNDAIKVWAPLGHGLMMTDGNDDIYVTELWHLALAYAAVGKMHDARAALIDAHATIDADAAIGEPVNPEIARGATADYARLGAKKSEQDTFAARWKADQASELRRRRAYAKTLSPDERGIVMAGGIPCHVETYSSSDYENVTFWYCNADGSYSSAYTFTNGKLTSTYEP